MVNYPTKTVSLTDGESETLYFDGHPRHDAVRVDATGDNECTVTFRVAKDDDPENITPADEAVVEEDVFNPTVDAYSGAGTTALGRTVIVEIEVTGATGNEVDFEARTHPASDPSENGHGFAYSDTYRSTAN